VHTRAQDYTKQGSSYVEHKVAFFLPYHTTAYREVFFYTYHKIPPQDLDRPYLGFIVMGSSLNQHTTGMPQPPHLPPFHQP
jgi:hypothetical protein